MTRLVRGADGRMWTVRSRMTWRDAGLADDFEYDLAGDNAPIFAMGAVVLVMVIVLVAWTPQGVIVPPWLVLAIALVFLFFPVRWLLRRPWVVVAETPGDLDEHPPERWVGTLRGIFNVRQGVAREARFIQVYSVPDTDGPLNPMD